MDTTLSTDEVYDICNALNAEAQRLEADAKRSRTKGHTFNQVGVVEVQAEKLRTLVRRLLNEKNEEDLNDFNYVGSRHHY